MRTINSVRDITEVLVATHNAWIPCSQIGNSEVIDEMIGPMQENFEFGIKNHHNQITRIPTIVLCRPENDYGEYFRFTSEAFTFAQQTHRKNNHRIARQCRRRLYHHSKNQAICNCTLVRSSDDKIVPGSKIEESLSPNKPFSKRKKTLVLRTLFRDPRKSHKLDKTSHLTISLRKLIHDGVLNISEASPELLDFSYTSMGKQLIRRNKTVLVVNPKVSIRKINECILSLQMAACNDPRNESQIVALINGQTSASQPANKQQLIVRWY